MTAAMLILSISAQVAPPEPIVVGPQPAISWSCELKGPQGENVELAGKFAAPDAKAQASIGSLTSTMATIERDSTGLLKGTHKILAVYEIPTAFMFTVKRGDDVTSFKMNYFGRSGGLVTIDQHDGANRKPTIFKGIAAGFCQTTESKE